MLWLCAVSVATAEPLLRVEVYSSPDSAEQREVVQALEAALFASHASAVRLQRLSIEDVDRPGPVHAPDLRVAIGTRAAERLSQDNQSPPRLYGFIPRPVWQQIKSCCPPSGGRDAALLLDRPPIEYLQLARALGPAAQRVGVLLGPASKSTETGLRLAAGRVGMDLFVGWVKTASRVGPVLRPLLEKVDVLLALPDPEVFNPETVYPVLLASYSAGLPVAAYSAAMVRAGAAASVLLSPADAGRDLAAEIARFAVTRRLRPTRSSPAMSVAINRDVLRTLRIDVSDEQELLRRMREAGP